MKYIVLLGDGMADYPLSDLEWKTPLEFADTPNMDRIAAEGTVGLIDTIPSGFAPEVMLRTCPCWDMIQGSVIPGARRWKRLTWVWIWLPMTWPFAVIL